MPEQQRGQPKSYTVWERLEPVARDPELTETLRAEVRDPAWLLARQWQVGEFQGNDGGSPVAVDLEYVQEPLSSVTLAADAAPVDYTPGEDPPLEAVIERERVLTDAENGPNYRIRMEAGMNFLARLREARRDTASSPDPSLPDPTDFPAKLDVGDETVDIRLDMADDHLDAEGRRFEHLAGEQRALDGYGVYRALDAGVPDITTGNPAWQQASADDLPLPADAGGSISSAFETAAADFYAWYVDLYDEPDEGTGDAWDENRLEYDFDATTRAGGTETSFEVEGYDGDRLDWDDFVVTGTTPGDPSPVSLDPSLPTSRGPNEEPEGDGHAPTPTRLTFKGMPAPRYWEMEDADVDLSTLSAAPEDVSWLTMVEVALVAGNKWFMLPLEAEYGSLTRITTFEVLDTFVEHPVADDADTTTVEPATPTDDAATAGGPDDGGKGWNMFQYHLPDRSEPGLLLPPVVGSRHRSGPVERVRFARDEAANLVFAIENLAEGPLGDPLDRREFDRPTLEVADVHPAPEADDEYIELGNPGDDDLDLDGWRLAVEVASGPLDFHGGTLTESGPQEVYRFVDVTIDPGSSVRLYTGGTRSHDTDDQLHLGAEKPLWARGKKLTSYRVERPATDASGSWEIVLENPAGTVDRSSLPRYRLASDVPDHWFPMTVTETGTDDYRLEVALLMDADTLGETVDRFPRPRGQVLTPHASVYDEAVTEQGTTVEREYNLALGADGRSHCWSGRTVTPGDGEASSGLRFDFLEESEGGGEAGAAAGDSGGNGNGG